MNITINRKKKFCTEILHEANSKIGFVDVGSGGELKNPWDILSPSNLTKYDFEPAIYNQNELALCISDSIGEREFYIAQDERSSSLLEPSKDFIDRFGQHSLNIKKRVTVKCETLDSLFEGKYREIDLLDVNTEGYDYQVLQGSLMVLEQGAIKLIKIEFELLEVWKNQGWLSDIDALLRGKSFDLARIDIDHIRPHNVRHIIHDGEPVWGKAYYVASDSRWKHMLNDRSNKENIEDDVLKGIALYTIIDAPGRALDLLDMALCSQIYIDPSIKTQIVHLFDYVIFDRVINDLKSAFQLPAKVFRKMFPR
jgi:FkbM family methyltransferase